MPGRHFLQIPGPTNVPDRILRAMDRPVPDHRGPELPALVGEILAGLKQIFQTTRGEIVLYPASGTGAWEASLVNTISPGWVEDSVLNSLPEVFQTGVRDWQEKGWTPMGRLGTPGDIGNAVALLCSEDAGYVSGQVIYVAGGPRA